MSGETVRPGLREDLRQVPHGHTAHRLDWRFLPPALRGEIERRLGSPVASSDSRDAGFTPVLASMLTGEDGSQVFVKAASKQAQAGFASSYLEEARKLALLPPEVPAPRLQWVHEDETWVVLGLEPVEGRPPVRPWRIEDLHRALDLAERIAATTDPVPTGLDLRRLDHEVPGLLSAWGRLPPRPHVEEALALAKGYGELDLTHFCHSDLRDDNVLLTPTAAGDVEAGGAVAVDWNWSTLGTPWQDTIDLLVSAYGDGIDVETIVAERALTREVDPDHIDRWLATLGGFMAEASRRRPPSTSPHLQTHSRWYAEALWGWLSERRGWDLGGPVAR